MSFKKKKKPLPDVGPSYDDGKLSFSGREEMDDLTENEQRMLTFSEMEPVELATHFEDLLGALEDDEANVRNAALLLLRQLEPSLLARHALRISACLEDDVKQVRRTAMQTLCDLDPALLPEDVPGLSEWLGLVRQLEDDSAAARRDALRSATAEVLEVVRRSG